VAGIEALEQLGEAFKWKIAFHYQNRQKPVIVDIFKRAPLAAYTGGTASQSMAALQKAALAKRPEDVGILEFGRQVWEAWSQKNLAIWKLSHGQLVRCGTAAVPGKPIGCDTKDTGKEQGQEVRRCANGHAVLPLPRQQPAACRAVHVQCHALAPRRWLVAAQLPRAQACPAHGSLHRQFQGWSPQGNSTFWQVGADDLPEFESTLLKPYFGTDLAELAALAGEPIEAASIGTGMAPAPSPVPHSPIGQQASRHLHQPHLLRPTRHRQNLHADATAQARLRAACVHDLRRSGAISSSPRRLRC
jgi:5-methylcytosine-specific restriction protein B